MKQTVLISLYLSLCLSVTPALRASQLRLHFISVGHGDAILIEQQGQALALIDTGLPEAGPNLLNYLRNLGVDRIEHLFITHTHRDHLGGAPLILDSLQVGVIHHTGMKEDKEPFRIFERSVLLGKWTTDTTEVGESYLFEDDLNFEVLSPPREQTAGKNVASNNHSLVLLITHGSIKILLTADIDQERESWLVEQYGEKLQSQVLKAPHHGADDGCSERLLQVVKPEMVVISTGPSQHGYPAEITLKRLRSTGATVLRTDEVGTVILESDGKRVTILSPRMEKP